MKTQPIFRTFERNATKRKLNLQLFAEPTPEAETHEEPKGPGDDHEPETDADVLRVQLAQANAQIAKLTKLMRLHPRTQPRQNSSEKK